MYVYAAQGSSFGTSPQRLLPTTQSTQGRFGDALDVNAGMIVVGAPQEGSGAIANRPGAGYLFQVTDGIVDPAQRFVPALNALGDKFGSSVAIADNGMVIVGAEIDDTGAGVDSGSAVIFRRNGATITETTTLLPDTDAAAQGAGAAVATNGDLILLGAPLAADASGQPRRGRVYAYEFEANLGTVETPIGVLENAGGAENDRFGRALAINRRQALAGVPLDDREIDSVLAEDVGRGDPFVLDRVFRDGLE